MNNTELPSQDYASSMTIGKGEYYIKIGTVYIASMEAPTEEQKAKLKADYGIDVVSEAEWVKTHETKMEEEDASSED